jgi:hypothetical protein
MSHDSCILGNQGTVPDSILAEADFACHQEAAEIVTWESAWIDIGGEG